MIFGSNSFFFLLLPLFCLFGALPVLACNFTIDADVINVAVYDMSSPAARLRNDDGMTTEIITRNMGNGLAGGKIFPKMSGLADLTFFSHSVRMINSPEFTSTPVTAAKAGNTYVYEITVTDPDDDALTITAKELPIWLELSDHGDGTATLKGTPQVTHCADKQVTLMVEDQNGLTAEQSFEIDITADLTVSVEADRVAICAGEPVLITFDATVTEGVTATLYEWSIDDLSVFSSSSSSFQTNSIRVNRMVKVKVTIEPTECIANTEATSEPLLIEVKESLEMSVVVEVEKNSICMGEPVTFTAILTEGGSNPVYTWFISDQTVVGETGAAFTTDQLADGDAVKVKASTETSDCLLSTEAESEQVSISVDENLTFAVSLTSDKTEITAGETVNFTAGTDHKASAVQYQWFINDVLVPGETNATFSSHTLENNDKVKVRLMAEPVDCLTQTEAESEEISIVVNDVVVPKVQDIAKTMDEDTELPFTTNDFFSAFTGNLATLRITALPLYGTLTLNGTSVAVNQEMAANQLSTLKYVPDPDVNGEDAFGWNGSNRDRFAAADAHVNITIHSINDAPAFTLSGNVFVSKNFTSVEQVTLTPEEVPFDEINQAVTYQLIPPTVSFATIIFDTQSGRVAITSILDQTGKQEFEIIANDGQVENNIHIESFILEVKSAYVFPPKDIAADNLFIPENQPRGTLIGTITVEDDDPNDRHVLNLDDHNTVFFIDGNQLKTNAVLDFEQKAIYEVSVRATDLGGNFLVEPFTITVTDENDPPTDLKIIAHEIVENEPIGTQIGKLTAIDQDAGDVLHYTLVADVADNALFALSDNVLVSNEVFDFEEREEFEIVVRVEDGNGGVVEEVITIVVIDVEPEEIEVISGFTPDNDRMNDTWEIPGLVSYPRCTVAVYNSWGQQVFFSRGYQRPWDGTYKNKDVLVGTYYYIIDLDNGQPSLTGNIAVMR